MQKKSWRLYCLAIPALTVIYIVLLSFVPAGTSDYLAYLLGFSVFAIGLFLATGGKKRQSPDLPERGASLSANLPESNTRGAMPRAPLAQIRTLPKKPFLERIILVLVLSLFLPILIGFIGFVLVIMLMGL